MKEIFEKTKKIVLPIVVVAAIFLVGYLANKTEIDKFFKPIDHSIISEHNESPGIPSIDIDGEDICVEWDVVNGDNIRKMRGKIDNGNIEKSYEDENPIVSPLVKERRFQASEVFDKDGNPNIAWSGIDIIGFSRFDGGKWVNIENEETDILDKHVVSWQRSKNPLLLLDEKGIPHILWVGYTDNTPGCKSDVMYTKWNGKNWVSADGEVFNPDNNSTVNISLDDDYCLVKKFLLDERGFPVVIWGRFDKLNLIRWDGENWVTIGGTCYIPNSGNAVIAESSRSIHLKRAFFDKHNKLCLFWKESDHETHSNNIVFVRWDGRKWVNSDGSDYVDSESYILKDSELLHDVCVTLKLDDDSNPHILIESDLKKWNCTYLIYIKYDGKNWVSADGNEIDINTENPAFIFSEDDDVEFDFAIDKNGVPHIVWGSNVIPEERRYQESSHAIKYVTWNGEAWVCADGTPYKPSKYKGE